MVWHLIIYIYIYIYIYIFIYIYEIYPLIFGIPRHMIYQKISNTYIHIIFFPHADVKTYAPSVIFCIFH